MAPYRSTRADAHSRQLILLRLSWSRSQGVFAGVALEGATLRRDLDDNSTLASRVGEPRHGLYLIGTLTSTSLSSLTRNMAPAGCSTSLPLVPRTTAAPVPPPIAAPVAAPLLPPSRSPIAAPAPAPTPILVASDPLVPSAVSEYFASMS
jgi:hypothetical protein